MIRFFLIFTLIFLTIVEQGQAQTPVSKETANTYYQNCKAQPDPRFSGKSQEMFCACTAVKMTESYTMEDMRAASQQNQTGRDATNKLIINVYAPCIQYPAREYHYTSCKNNPQTSILGGNAEKICQCASQKAAEYLQQNAASLFQDILSKNPNITDPMQALYDDPAFQTVMKSKLSGCLIGL